MGEFQNKELKKTHKYVTVSPNKVFLLRIAAALPGKPDEKRLADCEACMKG